MAIKKQFLKSKPVCKVTFTVPAEDAKKVSVVDGVYVNDEAADAYAWNDFAGAENGVVNV